MQFHVQKRSFKELNSLTMCLQILFCTIASSTVLSKVDAGITRRMQKKFFVEWSICIVLEIRTSNQMRMRTGKIQPMVYRILLLFDIISCVLLLLQTSMVLTCCARSEEPGSAERAERILLNMENLYAEGLSDAVANSRCYSAAITAWARSNSPIAVDRALALIDRMEQNGKNGSPHGKPNTHCYNAYIHAIAKSQHPHKAEKCKEVLQRMTAAVADGFYDSTPSSITYSTIINGECA